MDHQRILITGGAGFVGSTLAIRLANDFGAPAGGKASITCLDNLKRRGSELNIPRLTDAGIAFLHGDIRNPEDLAAAGEYDLMLECSAEPSVTAGYGTSPAYLLNTNLVGTINCLESCRERGADLVFLSTSRVYPMHTVADLAYEESATRLTLAAEQCVPGISPAGLSEAFPLTGPRTLYGTTKLASELLIAEYGEMYGLRAVVNRCAVLTGAWQMGKVDQGFMVLWVANHFFKKKLGYFGFGGTGKQVRDVLHAADLYDLLKLQLAGMDRHAGEVYNVGGGIENSTSLAELTALCQAATGHTIEITPVPETRAGDIPWYVTDNAKVTAATGWSPSITIPQTVEEIAAWLSENRDTLAPILG